MGLACSGKKRVLRPYWWNIDRKKLCFGGEGCGTSQVILPTEAVGASSFVSSTQETGGYDLKGKANSSSRSFFLLVKVTFIPECSVQILRSDGTPLG